MSLTPVTLRGPRVRLEPLQLSHKQVLFEAAQDPAIFAYMPCGPMLSLESMIQWIEDSLRGQSAGTSLPFAIIDLKTEQAIGSTSLLDYSAAHRQIEMGSTWLNPSVWRTRVNTECKYLLLTHCFETLGLIRVQLKTDLRNERSQRAIERIGGIREGILRRHRVLHDGFIRDSVYYSILDTEWPVVKMRLETMLEG